MSKRINIRSFSEKIGYSAATVSRALNPQTAHLVKEKTRLKIQDLAAQHDFVPHPGARILRRTSPAPIAVLLLQLEHLFLSEYYSRLLMGILRETSLKGQAVYAMDFKANPSNFREQLNAATVGCSGIIYLSDPLNSEMLKQLELLHQPFVCATGNLTVGINEKKVKPPVFGLDEIAGGHLVAEHLIGLGHKKIALINGPNTNHDAQRRRKGFELAMKEKSLPLPPEWNFTTGFNFEAGFEMAKEIKTLLSEVTAVVCGSDEIALGLIHGLEAEGINCPQDVSITGYDDLLWASRYTPALTTVRQPLMDMAVSAVQMISDLHAKPSGANKVKSKFFKPELILRETTAAPNR
ncbi:LacI family DNA-binding transcriptional regulator [Rubellicoccus peritrichatus]|uniref:LacI family DNA-binding transcriptional regulator n=1 Tax=Rubellicoccus peritrichatus TaxID=3080537 RepID=A0AAQ3QVH3_9BACT|nr:LacI family DNA-binding transcriptional regulator [Puniceicoccus sp. CR14]WOO41613.1 LacI family DNA-binding transcriptional regulator [Puniceicoccus sp. CR14]